MSEAGGGGAAGAGAGAGGGGGGGGNVAGAGRDASIGASIWAQAAVNADTATSAARGLKRATAYSDKDFPRTMKL